MNVRINKNKKYGILHNIIKGVASIVKGMATFSIFPPPRKSRDYRSPIIHKSDEEFLRESFEQVGKDIQYAMNILDSQHERDK